MNQAKRVKYDEEEAGSDSSSDNGNNLVVSDENEVLQIEFQGTLLRMWRCVMCRPTSLEKALHVIIQLCGMKPV